MVVIEVAVALFVGVCKVDGVVLDALKSLQMQESWLRGSETGCCGLQYAGVVLMLRCWCFCCSGVIVGVVVSLFWRCW